MKLNYEKKNIWEELSEKEIDEIFEYGERYKNFLDNAKIEREATVTIIEKAKENGYVSLDEALKGKIKKGDKIYLNNKNKSVIMMVVGDDITEGMNILGSHIDSPRLDLKQYPVYEEGHMAYFKTHYYGGVKKYQWTTLPLALHGTAFTKDGKKLDIVIGEKEEDPIFYISDLLIHLSKDQRKKTMDEGITGEQLNVIIGHRSYTVSYTHLTLPTT